MRKTWKKLVGVLCCCGVLSAFPMISYADIDGQDVQVVEVKPEEDSIKKNVIEGDEPEDDSYESSSDGTRVYDRTSEAQASREALAQAKAELDAARKRAENEAARQAWLQAEEVSSEEWAKSMAAAENAQRRQKVVEFALSFVGGPYRYGGNDPRTGVDCSGFTRYVLSNAAGVHIARTSSAQAGEGVAINDVLMQPGDLLFYSGGGRINHVAMYIGGGKVVHASSVKTGIKISPWNYRTPVKIVNVLGD